LRSADRFTDIAIRFALLRVNTFLGRSSDRVRFMTSFDHFLIVFFMAVWILVNKKISAKLI